MARIVIAEDHLLVRAGIRALLERNGEFQVLGEAGNGQEAIDLVRGLKPDVLIMDIMMPRLNGLQAAGKIQEEKLGVKILLLSMYSDASFVHQALQYGVKGYLLKSSVSDELIAAVQAVSTGRTYLSGAISEQIGASGIPLGALNPLGNPRDTLSPREKEILQLIVEEYTSAEIANLLFISEKTVEKHRSMLMEKLAVRNLAGLVRVALKLHLVDWHDGPADGKV